MSDKELMEVMTYLDRERCNLQRKLLSIEGVSLENSPVLPHTQNFKDAA